MAKKKQKTEIQIKYEKEYKRVKQFIRRAEKRGYVFSESITPKKLKRPTVKSIEKLSKMTPQYLYSKSKYTDTTSGKTVKGTEGRRIEQRESAKKSALTRKNKSDIGLKYSANIKRINELINELEANAKKRGYILPKNYLDNISEYINRLDISTNSVSQLERITEESILSSDKVLFRDPRTGSYFKGYEGLNIEAHRKKTEKEHPTTTDTPISESENVLEMVEEYIDTWTPSAHWTEWFIKVKERDKNTLHNMLMGAINSEGREVVAQRLQDNAERIIALVQEILYGSGDDEVEGATQINFNLTEFSAIIMGRPLTPEESIAIADTSELNEVW